MEFDVERLARLIEPLEPKAGATRLVAIDGPAGAGKTELAGNLAPLLGDVTVVHMDSLYGGWDGLDEGAERVATDLIAPLSEGRTAALRTWDWTAGKPGGEITVEPAATVIVEGVGSGSLAAAPSLSFLIWLDADPEERRRRALLRDGEAFELHWDAWARQEAAHHAREMTEQRADVRIRTDID